MINKKIYMLTGISLKDDIGATEWDTNMCHDKPRLPKNYKKNNKTSAFRIYMQT